MKPSGLAEPQSRVAVSRCVPVWPRRMSAGSCRRTASNAVGSTPPFPSAAAEERQQAVQHSSGPLQQAVEPRLTQWPKAPRTASRAVWYHRVNTGVRATSQGSLEITPSVLVTVDACSSLLPNLLHSEVV